MIRFVAMLLPLVVTPNAVRGENDSLSAKELGGVLERVTQFYRSNVGFHGAYVYRTSADLTKREGEGVAFQGTGWTQPPGTPAVGEAFLDSWKRARLDCLRDAALEVGLALTKGQLNSGGWDSRFELEPHRRDDVSYRVDGAKHGKNTTTFDDNKTQASLTFLMRLDEALEFENETIGAAVDYALDRLLTMQYPNGAWPQKSDNRKPQRLPQKDEPANYPETWPRTRPDTNYSSLLTLNDNNMCYLIDMFLEAHRIYDREDCERAALRTADFFLLAQMPQPQPGWAQQYDFEMRPAWARKFEPPAISGSESQAVIRSLIEIGEYTGAFKYLVAAQNALDYFENRHLPDGKLARFYELRTNRPLYFDQEYQLTYDDDDLPTHYAFKVSSKLKALRSRLGAVKERISAPDDGVSNRPRPRDSRVPDFEHASSIINALDERSAWVTPGRLRYHDPDDPTRHVIESNVFIQNLRVLAKAFEYSKTENPR